MLVFYCQSICKTAVTREAISTCWEFLKVASGFRTILHSKDDGEHWQPQTIEVKVNLRSVYGDGLLVWAVGESGTVLHSIDGGERWQLQTSGTTQTLTAICGDGARLWTVGTDFHHLVLG